jgi:hypothetical protein
MVVHIVSAPLLHYLTRMLIEPVAEVCKFPYLRLFAPEIFLSKTSS